MRNTCGRLASLARTAAVVAVALGLATPAAAQFGGLKKKLKQAAGQEGANKAAESAGATPDAAGGQEANPTGARGGAVVLTDEVVKQLIDGLKAGRAERDAAAKEDTPYGRFKQQEVAYASAKSKCEAAQQAWGQRAAADEKLMDRYSAMVDKMMKAQQKGDQKLTAIYSDSALAMMSPSCTVKQPTQPDKYYDFQREVDGRAEQAEMKASGLSRNELYLAEGAQRADPPEGRRPRHLRLGEERGQLQGRRAEAPDGHRGGAGRAGRQARAGRDAATRRGRRSDHDPRPERDDELHGAERPEAPEGDRGAGQAAPKPRRRRVTPRP